MRLVPDNNVLVRAAASPIGPAGAILPLIAPPHLLVLSSELFRELSEVLRYDRVQKLHGFSEHDINGFLRAIQNGALIIALPEGPPPHVVPADRDDDYLVATAVHARADVLCSRDGHLYHPDVLAYCRDRGIEIIDDVELLDRVRHHAKDLSHESLRRGT
jgi:putative PIN family toxin of toxin-antitoxin system